MNNKKAIVIGAGMGGLCAAIALQNEGWEVAIFDKAPSLISAGAGIVLAANAMKALQKLGVADKVSSEGAAVGKAEIRTWNGKLLVDLPTHEQAKRYGTHSYLIHRTNLQNILYKQLLANTSVQLNKRLLSFHQSEHDVIAEFDDGSYETGDVLIGADGIHSTVKGKLLGFEPLRYAGYHALRGVCHYNDQRYTVEQGGGFEALGPGKRFGFSHLGQGRVFWFAAINSPQGINIPLNKRKHMIIDQFQGWYDPIQAVIEATEESSILSHDLFDRKPLNQWSKGRVTLLGDAAHPMLPNLGQGGAQAMEDAVVLTRCLQAGFPSTPDALLEYERLRLPRTTAIVRQSRRMGHWMHHDNALVISMRNLMLRTAPSKLLVHGLDKVVGYEV